MEPNDSMSNSECGGNGPHHVFLRILVRENPSRTDGELAELALTTIADSGKQGVKEALAGEERLIDYPELAKRLGLGVRATKDLVNCGKITPALRYSNVARFHWPSVLQELKKHPEW